MTVQYHCDGPDCERLMSRREKRIAITVEDPPEPIVFDPDVDDQLPEIEIDLDIGLGDGDFHFCSDSCLTAWAMARALDER